MLLLPYLDGGEQGAYADPGGPEIVDFVDLEAGVDLAGAGEDIVDLIRSDGIQAAAEGIELDQVEVVPCLHITCGSIQSGVVHPLVGHD